MEPFTIALIGVILYLYVNRDKVSAAPSNGGNGGGSTTTTTNVNVGSTGSQGSPISGNTGQKDADDFGISVNPNVPVNQPPIVIDTLPTPTYNVGDYGFQSPNIPVNPTQSPAVGVNINDAGVRFTDMIFPDGSPRILTWSMLSRRNDWATFVNVSLQEMGNNARSMPDVIAWTAY